MTATHKETMLSCINAVLQKLMVGKEKKVRNLRGVSQTRCQDTRVFKQSHIIEFYK